MTFKIANSTARKDKHQGVRTNQRNNRWFGAGLFLDTNFGG